MRWSPAFILLIALTCGICLLSYSFVAMGQRQRALAEAAQVQALNAGAPPPRYAVVETLPPPSSDLANSVQETPRQQGSSLYSPGKAASMPSDLSRDLAAYRQAKPNDRKKLTDAIRQKLVKQFDQAHQTQLKELKKLEDRVTKIRSTLQTRASEREKIVDLRLTQLLREAEGLGWAPPSVAQGPDASGRSSDWLTTPQPSLPAGSPPPPSLNLSPDARPAEAPRPSAAKRPPVFADSAPLDPLPTIPSSAPVPAPTPTASPSLPNSIPAPQPISTPQPIPGPQPNPALPPQPPLIPSPNSEEALPPPLQPQPNSTPIPSPSFSSSDVVPPSFSIPAPAPDISEPSLNPVSNRYPEPKLPAPIDDSIITAQQSISRYLKAKSQSSKHTDDYGKQAFDAVSQALTVHRSRNNTSKDLIGVAFNCFSDEPCQEELDRWTQHFRKNGDPLGQKRETQESLFAALMDYRQDPNHDQKRCLPGAVGGNDELAHSVDEDPIARPAPVSRKSKINERLAPPLQDDEEEPAPLPSRESKPAPKHAEPPSPLAEPNLDGKKPADAKPPIKDSKPKPIIPIP